MGVTLLVIFGGAFICLACYARAAHVALKSTEAELRQAKQTIAYLKREIQNRPQPNHDIPDFLLADDPMDAILRQVGYAKKP